MTAAVIHAVLRAGLLTGLNAPSGSTASFSSSSFSSASFTSSAFTSASVTNLPVSSLSFTHPSFTRVSVATLNPATVKAASAHLSGSAGSTLGQVNPIWVTALVLGFPLLMLLLGESLRGLKRKQPALVAPLAIVRNWTLPALALYLLLVNLLARPRTAVGVRISETLVWITLIVAALTLLKLVLFEGAPKGSWQAKVPKLFRDLGSFLLVLIGSAIVLSSVWGADLGGFLTALGVGSLVLGLALQDSLGNIFSGVALLFEQPIGMGDWIQIGDSLGKVVEINWRAVHLQTSNDDLMVIPNSELAKGQFTNFSRPSPLHRVEIPIAFSYDDPPNRVRQLLIGAALEIADVLSQPPPNVVVESYGDFAINYLIQLYAPEYAIGEDIRDEMNRRIWYLASRHRLTMPYPVQQQMTYTSTVPSAEQQRHACLQLLRGTPGFAGLSADTLQRLLRESQVRSYATHEVVLQRLMPLDGLYLILEGEAELLITDDQNRELRLGVLLRGEMFGEKSSLLHGRLSDTMVRACDDLEVLVIGVEHLQELLLQSPRLGADLAEVIELRRRAIAEVSRAAVLGAPAGNGTTIAPAADGQAEPAPEPLTTRVPASS